MRSGRPTLSIVLTALERQELEMICRRAKAPQAEALRARVILACADGLNNIQVCKKTGLCPHTVGRLRKRFYQSRLEGILDLPRSGPLMDRQTSALAFALHPNPQQLAQPSGAILRQNH